MSLLDTLNSIIYWDEVNWQWLPYVSTKVNRDKLVSRLKRNGSYTSKNFKRNSYPILNR